MIRTARKPTGSRRSARAYRLYGLRLKSGWRLPCPEEGGPDSAEIELLPGSAPLMGETFREGPRAADGTSWFHHVRLSDGSEWLRWSGLFEFLVSADGRQIACHPLNGTAREAFHAYLLGQALSFALLKQGIEPLHATAVVIQGMAVGFVGDCGYGKSSLAAAFLQAGHPLLTDDLLVVKEGGGGFLAYPGPPRIKLFPGMARRLLGKRAAGVRMNTLTPKLVIRLAEHRKMCWGHAAPLRAIYVLTPPQARGGGDRIASRSLSPRRACIALLQSTFNPVVVEPARLARQLDFAARLARQVPVRSLSFPRRLARLPAVREAILSDLRL